MKHYIKTDFGEMASEDMKWLRGGYNGRLLWKTKLELLEHYITDNQAMQIYIINCLSKR